MTKLPRKKPAKAGAKTVPSPATRTRAKADSIVTTPSRAAGTKAQASQFDEVLALIEAARREVGRVVNIQLIDLYWKIGEVISRRIERDGWGKGTVQALAVYLARTQRGARGFSPQNLWRMRQFFEAYRDASDLSTLLRALPWSAHLHVLSGAKSPEEREFYLRTAASRRWNVRELARQLQASAFERSVLGPPKLSAALRELHPAAVDDFKDVYSLEFVDLANEHSEADLHGALLRNLGRFITELGRDFCFVGSEYPVQVGNQDFAIDLVFFHRSLQCLVAFELKVDKFKPADLGQLSFYVEALDRDVKKPHERPSIGVLLCATKDDEVVEYALARTSSPTLVAEYQTVLPPKKLLQQKLHELYAQLAADGPPTDPGAAHPESTRPASAKKGAR